MTTFTSRAHVATATPERYVVRLCKHFAHKTDATWEGGRGRVGFPFGTCTLAAEDGALALTATAGDADALARLEDVVGRHLLRFAEGREALSVSWSPAAPQPAP